MFGKHFDHTKSYERYADLSKYLREIGADKAVEDYIQLMPWGTPQQVLEKLAKTKETIDMQGIMPNFNFGGMPHEESVRNVKTFVKHCMPELKSWPCGDTRGTEGTRAHRRVVRRIRFSGGNSLRPRIAPLQFPATLTAMRFEIGNSEWWKLQLDGVRPVVPRDRLRIDSARIAQIGPAVVFRIGIENFAVVAGPRHSHAILFPHHRREIAHDDE